MLDETLEVLRLRLPAAAEPQSEPTDEVAELLDLLGVRTLVGAIKRGDVFPGEVGGNYLVGPDHELLDEPVGLVALRT